MAQRVFLLIHGLDGSGPKHWQHWLRVRLEADGEQVCFPDFPSPESPQLYAWLDVLDQQLTSFADRQIIVLAHSLGAMLWLHHSMRETDPVAVAERVLLIGPTSPFFWDPRAEGFLPMSLDGVNLAKTARSTRVVSSDNDPFCPLDDLRELEHTLNVACDVIPEGAHLNGDSGFGPWPSIEAWALHQKVPLVRD